MRISLLAFASLILAGTATADVTLSIPLELGHAGSVEALSYSCGDGEQMSVQYVNTDANTLAIVPIDGQDRVFVNVVSASGAQYVSGAHVWWTKGDTATLENSQEAAQAIECEVRNPKASE